MNSNNDIPECYARFYDVICNSLNNENHNYFLNKIMSVKGPVLIVGVGTGSLFIDGLKKGADVYGVDSNSFMIDILKSKIKEADHNRVSVQKFAELYHDLKFDLIIAPGKTVSQLLTVEDQQSAINKIYAHLNPWGTFVFDLDVPDPAVIANGKNNVSVFDGEYAPGKKLKKVISSTSDIVNQISDITMKYSWDEDGKIQNETVNIKKRLVFRFEIEHLIGRSKLKMISICGDYKDSPLDKNSRYFVVACQKLGMLPR